MDVVRTIGALLLAVGVGALMKLIFNRIDKARKAAAHRRRRRIYKRYYAAGQATVEQWRRENEPRRKKRQNIIVKDPRWRSVWEV